MSNDTANWLTWSGLLIAWGCMAYNAWQMRVLSQRRRRLEELIIETDKETARLKRRIAWYDHMMKTGGRFEWEEHDGHQTH